MKPPCADPKSSREASSTLVGWVLRAGVAGCFIGHGAFGIIAKAAWVPYFAVADVSEPWAWRLMPWIGAMDITVGVLALAWPCRAVFVWAAAWGLWTALLRPLSGESCWEFWERAGNYGVPIALIVVAGWRGGKWLRLPSRWPSLATDVRARLSWALRWVTVALLVGHAGCTLMEPRGSFVRNLDSVWPNAPAGLVPGVGYAEVLLAAGVLICPSVTLLAGICLWKLATECLFLLAGSPVWEVVERFGSYTAPLALAIMLKQQRQGNAALEAPAPSLLSHP